MHGNVSGLQDTFQNDKIKIIKRKCLYSLDFTSPTPACVFTVRLKKYFSRGKRSGLEKRAQMATVELKNEGGGLEFNRLASRNPVD